MDSSENSTTLLGMPTHLVRSSFTDTGPYSCRLVSLLRCRLVTRVTLRQLPKSQPFVWFRAKTDKGIVCLADHLHSVTMITIYSSKQKIRCFYMLLYAGVTSYLPWFWFLFWKYCVYLEMTLLERYFISAINSLWK